MSLAMNTFSPLNPRSFHPALVNDLEGVRWLVENNIPLPETILSCAVRKDYNKAISLFMSGQTYGTDVLVCMAGDKTVDIDIFRFFCDKKTLTRSVFDAACQTGRLDVLNYLYQKCPWENIFTDNINALEWLYSKNYPHFCFIAYEAAKRGNLNILKWMKNKGIKLESFRDMYHYAKYSGNKELINWVRENLLVF